VRRLTKKRLHWLGALPLMGLGGSMHYDRWPCKHPWKDCRCLGNLHRSDKRKGIR